MDGCVWVPVCVHGRVVKGGILFSASLTSIRVSRGIPLSILAERPHKEQCLRNL